MDARLQEESPVLVIGMHRSGTRLIAEILENLGVFMGADQQADRESVTFLLINEGIFHQCGTFWNEPMPVHFVLSQPQPLEQMTLMAGDALSAQLARYAGRPAWRPGGSGGMAAFGWKDPRNTFTAPVWRQAFPKLRLIHVLRHGVDVAESLSRRHGAALRAATGDEVPPALTVLKDHGLGVLSSRRGWTREEAFAMWEQYVEKAKLEVAELGHRALEVRFEELLAEPRTLVPRIAEFCGLPPPERTEAVIEQPAASRAFAYRRDPALVAFAQIVRASLARHGYAP